MKKVMLPKIKFNFLEKEKKIAPHILFKMNFDGCSKGNPGFAGAGAVISMNENEIWSDSFFIGEKITNNHAEYTGLIRGLQQAIEFDIRHLIVEGDSLLVINQMKGNYKCESNNIIELYNRAKDLSELFETINFVHILRNKNKRADELANFAVKKYIFDKNKEDNTTT
jgi:ribonuclease HI